MIQAALFVGWYKLYDDKSLLTILIALGGGIISLILIIILKRETEYLLYYEEYFRDIEKKISTTCGYDFNFITYDKIIFKNRDKEFQLDVSDKPMIEIIDSYWRLSYCNLTKKHIINSIVKNNKLLSLRYLENYILPLVFLIAWLIILLISILNKLMSC